MVFSIPKYPRRSPCLDTRMQRAGSHPVAPPPGHTHNFHECTDCIWQLPVPDAQHCATAACKRPQAPTHVPSTAGSQRRLRNCTSAQLECPARVCAAARLTAFGSWERGLCPSAASQLVSRQHASTAPSTPILCRTGGSRPTPQGCMKSMPAHLIAKSVRKRLNSTVRPTASGSWAQARCRARRRSWSAACTPARPPRARICARTGDSRPGAWGPRRARSPRGSAAWAARLHAETSRAHGCAGATTTGQKILDGDRTQMLEAAKASAGTSYACAGGALAAFRARTAFFQAWADSGGGTSYAQGAQEGQSVKVEV